MDIRKRFGTNPQLEEEGVWYPVGDGRIRIARVGNPAYRELFTRLSSPYKRSIRNMTLPEETAEEILLRVMSKTIVVDWEGITDNGAPLPYSPENAYMLLKEVKDFRELVGEISGDMEAYRAQDVSEAEKNS